MRKATAIVLSLFLAISFALILTSCEGDEGPTGPPGPAGQDAVFTITTVEFTGEDAGITGSYSYFEVEVPEITQDVIDNGCVLAYLNNSTGSTIGDAWILMPFSRLVDGEVHLFTFAYEPGYVSFNFATTAVDWGFPSTSWYHYKIVIFMEAPPGTVNLASFKEVERYCLDRSQAME